MKSFKIILTLLILSCSSKIDIKSMKSNEVTVPVLIHEDDVYGFDNKKLGFRAKIFYDGKRLTAKSNSSFYNVRSITHRDNNSHIDYQFLVFGKTRLYIDDKNDLYVYPLVKYDFIPLNIYRESFMIAYHYSNYKLFMFYYDKSREKLWGDFIKGNFRYRGIRIVTELQKDNIVDVISLLRSDSINIEFEELRVVPDKLIEKYQGIHLNSSVIYVRYKEKKESFFSNFRRLTYNKHKKIKTE